MPSLRRRLRLWAVVWLVGQAASLAAFVPRSCCALHDHAGERTERPCHEPPAAEACPMADEQGAACPMHTADRPSAAHDGHAAAGAPTTGDDCCVMRGTCDGPPLFTLLAQPGTLATPAAETAPVAVARLQPVALEALVSLAVPPDSPPPRA